MMSLLQHCFDIAQQYFLQCLVWLNNIKHTYSCYIRKDIGPRVKNKLYLKGTPVHVLACEIEIQRFVLNLARKLVIQLR